MKKLVFLKKEIIPMRLALQGLLFFGIAASILFGCKKSLINDSIPYNSTIDTATLLIKVQNPPLASGVDVTEPSTKLILFLFDSKNMYLSQASYNGIHTEDTSIRLHGIKLGHYTALLVADGPGITNLSYLKKGENSYQEVLDTLQELLTGSYVGAYQDINYVGVSQNILVNQTINYGTLTMQPLYSIISQIYFDLSKVSTSWQNVPSQTDGVYFLIFQNDAYVKKINVPDSAIKNKRFSTPVPHGGNYTFLFTDLTRQTDTCVLADSLKKGESTLAGVQALAERYNNNIRMGVGVSANSAEFAATIPAPDVFNLSQTIVEASVVNSMATMKFTFPTVNPMPINQPSNSEGLGFVEFQNGKLARQMKIDQSLYASGSVELQVLKGENYGFMFVDLLKNSGLFYLTDSLRIKRGTLSTNDIQSWVEPYNDNMRMGYTASLTSITAKDGSYPITNGLQELVFDLKNLVSKTLPSENNTDGFALVEFKDGVRIKQIAIPYITGTTTIPNIYKVSVVKSNGYNFWFIDLIRTADGGFTLKDYLDPTLTNKNINVNTLKSLTEPYLNQNMRMGSIYFNKLVDTVLPATNEVISQIEPVKLTLAGTYSCDVTHYDKSNNWSILILDSTGYYKRTAVRNVPYSEMAATPFNIFKGSKYTITAVGNFGTSINNVELTTTNYSTLSNINTKYPPVQPLQYSWLATDSCLAGQTTYENRVHSGTITITATTATNTPIKTLTRVDLITNRPSIGTLRKKGSGYKDFSCDPLVIKGIVTSNGKGENDLPNLIVVQDPDGTTTQGAIPIQFKTDPGLDVGDQVAFAVQDGDLTTSNSNANHMLVLQNVTYTQDPTTTIAKNQSVSTKSLGNITSLSPSADYEAMLVSVNNVEFRYWNGQTYYDLINLQATPVDYIELRDATASATTLPSKRPVFRLKMNTALSQFGTFGNASVPAGKGRVTGHLTKNSSNQYSIQPRSKSDISFTNTKLDRVDKGILVYWDKNNLELLSSNHISPKQSEDYGIARENSYFVAQGKSEGSGKPNVYISNSGDGSSEARPGVYINYPPATPLTGYSIKVYIDTKELAPGESIVISELTGDRGTYTSVAGLAGGGDLIWDINYSIDGGPIQALDPSTTLKMPKVAGSGGVGRFSLSNATPITIPSVGGSSYVIISFDWVSGQGTRVLSFWQNDCWSSFRSFKLEQK